MMNRLTKVWQLGLTCVVSIFAMCSAQARDVLSLPLCSGDIFRVLPSGTYAGDPIRLKEIPISDLAARENPYLILNESSTAPVSIELGDGKSSLHRIGMPGDPTFSAPTVLMYCSGRREAVASPFGPAPQFGVVFGLPQNTDSVILLAEFHGRNEKAESADITGFIRYAASLQFMPDSKLQDSLKCTILVRETGASEWTEVVSAVPVAASRGELLLECKAPAKSEVCLKLMVGPYSSPAPPLPPPGAPPDMAQKMANKLFSLLLKDIRLDGVSCLPGFAFP